MLKLAALGFSLPLLAFAAPQDYKPNPVADTHAQEIRAKCESSPAISIFGKARARGLLLHPTFGWRVNDPEGELLKRHLTFLEVNSRAAYTHFSETDKKELIEKGVTRYYFADIDSDDCKEFRARASRHPFISIPHRRLGLPPNLCIAKKENVAPQSQYFYYVELIDTPAVVGTDKESRRTLAKFDSLEKIAEVVGFHYCDNMYCWHGFQCFRDAEAEQILGLVEGIPDERIRTNLTIDVVSPQPFKENRVAKMVLVESSPATSTKLPERASGNWSAVTSADATAYITTYDEPAQNKGSVVRGLYALETLYEGSLRRVRITADGVDYDHPSTLRTNTREITFVAAPVRSGFRELNERYFKYSWRGDPLSIIQFEYVDFAKTPNLKYYFEDTSYEQGKMRLVVLEARIDRDVVVLNRLVFREQ